jgi:hypothetical protein
MAILQTLIKSIYLKVTVLFCFVGHDTFITGLVGDLVSQCKKSNVDSRSDKVRETSTNLAVTVGSVCAVFGLIVAAVVVCCKCRKSRPPVKQIKSG